METRHCGSSYTGVYRIAGVKVRFNSCGQGLHDYCREYRVDAPEEMTVEIRQSDIDHEREELRKIQPMLNRPVDGISDSFLEITKANFMLADLLWARDIFLMHGSAVAVDDACYIFSARSGVGKSTHSRLWRQLFGARAVMVNDDKPYVRVQSDGQAFACGTPWNGKEHLGTNTIVPLKAICLLERSEENWIREIPYAEALSAFAGHVYKPKDPVAKAGVILLMGRMKVKYYRMGCNMDISAAELAYNTMKE